MTDVYAQPSIDSKMTLEELRIWYGGYYAPDGTRLYRHSSVWQAMTSGQLVPYTIGSGTLVTVLLVLVILTTDRIFCRSANTRLSDPFSSLQGHQSRASCSRFRRVNSNFAFSNRQTKDSRVGSVVLFIFKIVVQILSSVL